MKIFNLMFCSSNAPVLLTKWRANLLIVFSDILSLQFVGRRLDMKLKFGRARRQQPITKYSIEEWNLIQQLRICDWKCMEYQISWQIVYLQTHHRFSWIQRSMKLKFGRARRRQPNTKVSCINAHSNHQSIHFFRLQVYHIMWAT